MSLFESGGLEQVGETWGKLKYAPIRAVGSHAILHIGPINFMGMVVRPKAKGASEEGFTEIAYGRNIFIR